MADNSDASSGCASSDCAGRQPLCSQCHLVTVPLCSHALGDLGLTQFMPRPCTGWHGPLAFGAQAGSSTQKLAIA
jgi:hypothetical protein